MYNLSDSLGIIVYIMPMLEPKELKARRENRAAQQKKHRQRKRWPAALMILVAIYVAVVSVIPAAPLQASTESIAPPLGTVISLPWPRYGQSAIGAVGFGLLAQNGDQNPTPIASVAKVITALAVLKERPITEGQPPAILTMTQEDVALYRQYAAEGQSHVAVEAGEQLTEYQALQALLLPSANNMAEVLARWAFGSQQNYLDFVNPFTKTLGMKNTTIADASGFSPQTVSTATDLALLAEIAMNHPVISEIVGQAEADIPVAGRIQNVNNLLGQQGIVGIKTGNTDEAGGCYLFSSRRDIDSENKVTLIGVIIGAPTRQQALEDSLPLIDEAFKGFKVTSPVRTNQIVGKIKQPGGSETEVVVGQGLAELTWGDQKPNYEVKLKPMGADVKQSQEVGKLTVILGNMTHDVPLVAAETIPRGSLFWRVRRAAGYL